MLPSRVVLQNPKKATSKAGHLAEDFAVNFLISKGYKILDRNFRSRFGEIDIVAEDSGSLIFVEVKARWTRKFGAPEEAVTRSKLWKIQQTGNYFSMLHPELPKKLRIDVVALEIENGRVSSAKIIKVY